MSRQQHDAESMTTGFIATSLSLPDVGKDLPIECPDVKTQSSLISKVIAPPKAVMDVFEPFSHECSVSLSSDISGECMTLCCFLRISVGASVLISGESIVLNTVQCRFKRLSL